MSATEVPFTSLLSRIVDNRGRTAPTAGSGIPLIATNCIKDEALYPVFEKVRFVSQATYDTWFRGHPQAGDIIFVCKGSPGRVALVPDPVTFCIAQDMVAVRPNPSRVYPRYLFAVLRSRTIRARIDNMHVGTLIPHFKKGDFGNLMIPVVDELRQRTIGDAYFELSSKVESNRRAVDIAEALGDALFARVSSEAFALSDVASLTMGSSPPGSSYNEDGIGIPFYQGVRDFGRRYPRRRVWTTEPVRLAEVGDTLVSVRAPVGNLNRASERCCVGRGVAAVRCDQPSTLYYALRAANHLWAPFQQEGTVFGAINRADLASAKLMWPAPDVIAELDGRLGALDLRIRSLSVETARLAQLRDALLPGLLAGSVGLSETSEAVT
jgi:type I restriction enzyme S subunit